MTIVPGPVCADGPRITVGGVSAKKQDWVSDVSHDATDWPVVSD
jgi:hypothetical protein